MFQSQAIQFMPCGIGSPNPSDIANVYCGRCHTFVLDGLHQTFYHNRDLLPMWTLYDRPRDFPESYVARLFMTYPQQIVTACLIVHYDLEALRRMMPPSAARLLRSPGDEPQIIETWL